MENKNEKYIFKLDRMQAIIENKTTEDLLYCLNVLEIRAVSIGEGVNADVYIAEGTPFEKVCLKRIKKVQKMICNDIDTENKFQIEAQQAGVRTPLPLISLQTDKGPTFIMERIKGYSMKDILGKPALLPKKFKYENFFQSLKKQISLMHNSGIYHRDLHSGNVMVDNDGLPVIIDFGTATKGTGSEMTYQDDVRIYDTNLGHYKTTPNIFDDDLESIDKLKDEFKRFM